MTVSPRKSCNVSIVLFDRAMTELSSLTASVTMREFGFFFFFRIAVDVSSSTFFSAPEASLLNLLVTADDALERGNDLL